MNTTSRPRPIALFRLSLLPLCLAAPASLAAPAAGNRLAYLDERSPFHAGAGFPRLTTPMWFGEEGVEAAVILSIDDLGTRSVEKYRDFLTPILARLEEIEGESPLNIFANTVDPAIPQLGAWIERGVRLDVHTRSHPCPLLGGGFAEAVAQVLDSVDGLHQVPGNRPVAFRMPCCDSINSASPRFLSEILPRRTRAGHFLEIDSSVLMFPEASYAAYAPFPSFATTATGYPYPYVIGRLLWEFPIIAPTDWQGQHRRRPFHEETVADIRRGIDIVAAQQGLYTWCFHPHGWIRSDQIVEVIDHVARKYGRKVRFVTFHQALERLNRHLLGGASLRAPDGGENGVRLLDVDGDGWMDVVIGNDERRETRRWDPRSGRFLTTGFPFRLAAGRADGAGGGEAAAATAKDGAARETGVRFGVLEKSGRASALVANEDERGIAHFDGERWVVAALESVLPDAAGFASARGGRDRGARLRDIDGDGLSDLLLNNESESSAWRWEAAAGRFTPFPFTLPGRAAIVDAEGNDRGLRFGDLDRDGDDDLILSNDDEYYVYLFAGAAAGWSERVLHGPADSSGALPKIASRGEDRGAWLRDGVLYVASEETARLPDLVDVVRFEEILAHRASPPLEPEAALASFRATAGFRVELAAAEPLVLDPVSIEFSPDGRVWCAEMGDYPDGQGGDAGGRVRFLRDTDADGRLDESTLFADGLAFPTCALPFAEGVLVASAPDILYLADEDGDGKAERREKVFSGFGEGNHQHRVNGLHRGLDGWIYGANGDSGGVITLARAPAGAPGVAIGGRDFRFRPDLTRFEAVSGHTQHGLAFDDFGNRFGAANSRHLMHAVLPESYLRRNPFHAVPDAVIDIPDHGAMGRIFQVSRQLLSLNDIHVPGHFSSACGLTIYRGHAFPAEYRGNAFVCEPVGNIVHRDVLVPEGATFRARRGDEGSEAEFLASTDNWFRPVYATTGPDGALWIVDMYRWVIEHPQYIPKPLHRLLDFTAGRDRGRIYRVVHETAPRAKRGENGVHPNLFAASAERLVELLEHPGGWWRDTAARLLIERAKRGEGGPRGPRDRREREAPHAVTERLRALARQGAAAPSRLHALWTLEGLEGLDAGTISAALEDPHPAVREHALRLAEPHLAADAALRRQVIARAEDGAFRVRLQAAFTLGEMGGPVAPDGDAALAALAALTRRDLDDRWMRAAILSSSFSRAGGLLGALFTGPDALAGDAALLVRRDLLRTALRRGDPGELRSLLATLADGRPGDASRDVAPWHLELFAILEEGAAGSAAELLEGTPGAGETPEEAARTRRAAARIRERARELALAEDGDLEERRTAIRVLGAPLAREKELAARLLALRVPQPLQIEAVRAIARAAPGAGGEAEERLLEAWPGAGPAARDEILGALLARPEGMEALLDALEDGRVLHGEVGVPERSRLREASDAAVRERALRLFRAEASPAREEIVTRYRDAVERLEGDAEAGEAVFRDHCAPCHRLDGLGFAVGPDLAEAGVKEEAAVIEAILNPGGIIPPRYRPYTVVTRSGEVASGIIAGESATAITLLRAHGIEETFLRADLRELRAEARSLMPLGLEAAIGTQAMADLLAFLRRRPLPLDGLEPARAEAARRELLARGMSGLAAVVRASGREEQVSWIGRLPMAFARQLDGKHEVLWRTEPVPAALPADGSFAFRFPAALGYVSEPRGAFTLWLGERRLLDFDVVLGSETWRSEDGRAALHYAARAANREDSTGLMTLELPAVWLEPGKPATLRVTGSASGSRRWFGLLLLDSRGSPGSPGTPGSPGSRD